MGLEVLHIILVKFEKIQDGGGGHLEFPPNGQKIEVQIF